MKVFLSPVDPHEKDALWRLLQFSLYEESAHDGNRLNDRCFFDYPYFPLYFQERDRQAFFLREEATGCILGFAMVNTCMRRAGKGHSIAEFMVLPGYRRLGVGTQAAQLCFALHPGVWEVAPALGSDGAYRFWHSVVSSFTHGDFTFSDGLFTFSRA